MTLALAGLKVGLLTGEADAEILDDEIAYLLVDWCEERQIDKARQ